MWVRKSSEKTAREHRRLWLSIRGPVAWFVVVYVAEVAFAIQGPYRHVDHWPSTLSQILSGAALIAATFAVVLYVLQLVLRSGDPLRLGSKLVMCDTCHRVKHFDRKDTCECGGKFEEFDNWTWIDGDAKGDGDQ